MKNNTCTLIHKSFHCVDIPELKSTTTLSVTLVVGIDSTCESAVEDADGDDTLHTEEEELAMFEKEDGGEAVIGVDK